MAAPSVAGEEEIHFPGANIRIVKYKGRYHVTNTRRAAAGFGSSSNYLLVHRHVMSPPAAGSAQHPKPCAGRAAAGNLENFHNNWQR